MSPKANPKSRVRAPFFSTATASSTARWSATACRIRRRSLGEFEILPDVAAACAKLKQAGFLLVVATNQPDVGRGTLKKEMVEMIHAEMCRRLPIDRVEVCYHPGQGAIGLRLPQAQARHVAARGARTGH